MRSFRVATFGSGFIRLIYLDGQEMGIPSPEQFFFELQSRFDIIRNFTASFPLEEIEGKNKHINDWHICAILKLGRFFYFLVFSYTIKLKLSRRTHLDKKIEQ